MAWRVSIEQVVQHKPMKEDSRWEAWKDFDFNELQMMLANRSGQEGLARATSHLGPETTASNDAELETCISGKYTIMRSALWPLCLSKLQEHIFSHVRSRVTNIFDLPIYDVRQHAYSIIRHSRLPNERDLASRRLTAKASYKSLSTSQTGAGIALPRYLR
jgi:hypothetical protein